MSVTTTSLRQGKFETRFWHKIFEEEVGRVKGHFGPINTYVSSLPYPSFALHLSYHTPHLQGWRCIRLERALPPGVKTASCACTNTMRAISRRSRMVIL
jgi:hypothetical protein